MAEDRKQVIFEVSPGQKEKWESVADERGFNSYSEFYRTAISKEAANGSQDTSEASENVSAQLSELTQAVNRIGSQVQEMDTRVRSVEREVRDDPEVKQLASTIFSILPTKQDALAEAQGNPRGPHETRAKAGTIESIAETLEKEEYEVEQAIEQLQRDTHQVSSMKAADEIGPWIEVDTPHSGETTRYYKEQ